MSYIRSAGYRLKDPDDDEALQVVIGDLERLFINLARGSQNSAYTLKPEAEKELNSALGQAPDNQENSDSGGSGQFLEIANNLGDLSSTVLARANLGLGTLATKNYDYLDVPLVIQTGAGANGLTVRASTVTTLSPYFSLYANPTGTVGATLAQTTTNVFSLAVFNTSFSKAWTFDCSTETFTSAIVNTNTLAEKSGTVITVNSIFEFHGNGASDYAHDEFGNRILSSRQTTVDSMAGYPYTTTNFAQVDTALNEIALTLKDVYAALAAHGLIT